MKAINTQVSTIVFSTQASFTTTPLVVHISHITISTTQHTSTNCAQFLRQRSWTQQ